MAKSRQLLSRCGLWGALSFVSFLGFECLASIPTVPEFLQVGAAALGYVALLLFISCALRVWRSDWSDLWFLPTGRTSKKEATRTGEPAGTRRNPPRTLVFRQ